MSWVFGKLRLFFFFVIFLVSLVVLLGVTASAFLLTLPDVAELEKCIVTTMYKVHLCPSSNSYVQLHDVSPYVLHAVISAEDGLFYSHKGFDWYEMKQSLNANMHAGGFRRGGSTLTQQLAKNVFLDQEKSLWRKLKEAYLAHAIENRYDKNFILEKYLNVVEFGPGIYGIKAAAQHYFNKPPSALHPLEAAYLAMLLPNPKKYSQSSHLGRLTPYARKMVRVILQRMQSFGKLSPGAYHTAVASLDAFPWTNVYLSSFAGSPGYGLDSDATPAPIEAPPDDEVGLKNLTDEDFPSQREAPPPPTDELPQLIPSDQEPSN